jgi:hypothetical protein
MKALRSLYEMHLHAIRTCTWQEVEEGERKLELRYTKNKVCYCCLVMPACRKLTWLRLGCRKGIGVFVAAGRAVKKGEVLSAYMGRAVQWARKPAGGDYVIDVDAPVTMRKQITIDGADAASTRIASRVNHSCDPNCNFDRVLVEDQFVIAVIAKKSIDGGSEITVDYKEKSPSRTCGCGSAKCRGRF